MSLRIRILCVVLAIALLGLAGGYGSAKAAVTGKIAGRVIDASGKSLPGANVVLMGTRRGAVTDADGFYTILLVEPGIYEMEASLIGYQKVRQREVKVLVDFTTTVNFRLKETAIEAGEVVVTAERPAVEPDKTASKHYVTAEDIELTPVVKSAQAFAGLQPGVQHDGFSVRQGNLEVAQGDREVGWNSTTPGPVSISYTVDGVRMVNNDGRAANLFVGVNRASVQEISIVTGVPEAEYGNMDAGIINMDSVPTVAGSKFLPDFGQAKGLDDPVWNGFRDYPRRAFQVSAYVQDKMEFEGMVVNVGVRYDGFFHRGQFRIEPFWNSIPNFRRFSDMMVGMWRNAQNPYPGDPQSFPTWGGKDFHRFTPRFGVSHPITSRSAIRFSYGRFMVLPIFYTLYGWSTYTATGNTMSMDLNGDGRISSYEAMAGATESRGVTGNPGMLSPTAVNYEVGVDWNFALDYTLATTLFYRRSERYAHVIGTRWSDPSEKVLFLADWAVNSLAMETRGLELSVSKRLSSYFSFRASYSWYWEQNNTFSQGALYVFPDENFIKSGTYRYKFAVDPKTGERIWQPLTESEIKTFSDYANTQIEQQLAEEAAGTGQDIMPSQKFAGRRPTANVGAPWSGEKNVTVRGWNTAGGGIRGPNDQRDAPSDGSVVLLFATPPGFGPSMGGLRVLEDLNLNLVLRVDPGTFFKYSSPIPSPSTNNQLVQTSLVFRSPTSFSTDLGVEKGFRVGKLRPVVFFEATNLFNAKKPKPIRRWDSFNDIPKYGWAENQPSPELLRAGGVVWDEWDSYQNRTRELYFGVRISM